MVPNARASLSIFLEVVRLFDAWVVKIVANYGMTGLQATAHDHFDRSMWFR